MIYCKILSHLYFLVDPINNRIIVIIVNYIYIYINCIIMMVIVVVLLLHFTNEEIDSEGLGVCKGLAKTYN